MDFSKSKIKHLIIHEIGNKLRDEKIFLSPIVQTINEHLENILLNYFLKSFLTQKDFYCFNHNSNLNLNEIYIYAKSVFSKDNEKSFIEMSQHMAKHLYEYSLHPKIVRGEFLIVQISNIVFNNKIIDLIGIFKSENKDSFLKVIRDENSIEVKDDTGINISKLEKGCLILNINENDGYIVLNIDNYNQNTDYWTNKFLNLKLVNNESYKTKEIMKICKKFSDEILSKKYDVNTKFTFNNDYINYFEDTKSFDSISFNEMIFKNENMKKDFYQYKELNKNSFEFDFDDRFDVSLEDVKKEKKKIKNVIKLDAKLELKILLNKENGTENIEKGFDTERGMSYYKIYFNEEIN